MKIKFRCTTINNERGGRIGIPNIEGKRGNEQERENIEL